MITLITGTPGAGKTLYTVANLLRELVGSEVDSTDDNGQPCKVPRVVFTNINGFMLDHEKIDGREGGGLADWHKWAKPGAVICFDEVQKEWPVRPNGSKVPDCIQALETHRHMGVDFIVITQGPNLIDQNLRALVGRHLHVRRMGGVSGSVVYEWDHCSRQLLYKNALTKKAFRYPKDAYQLYKSAELHTKPKISVPGAAFIAIGALVASFVLAPYLYHRIASRGDTLAAKQEPKPVQTVAASSAAPADPPKIRPLKIPDMPRDLDAIKPPAPIPVEALEYAGALRSDDTTLHVFKRPGGGVIKGPSLVAQGYKVESEDGCTVTVSYGSAERTFLCSLGVPSPGQTQRPTREIDRAMDRLARPGKPHPLPSQRPSPWSSEGMQVAAGRPLF